MEAPQMLTGPIEGQLLRMLLQMIQAKNVLEIGMFTGYSALSMAAALPQDGRLITCEINPAAIEIASRYFKRSPHGHKIELRQGAALKTLGNLQHEFDLIFIDADKENYPAYWEALLPKVKTGGLIAADNVLWGGTVLKPRSKDELAIVRFNDIVARDPRVECVLLTIRDGLTLARKK